SYRASVRELFPETRSMTFDPWLGPAGGWAGSAEAYFRFASRAVPAETTERPVSRPGDLPYGLGWVIGPDYLTHFGALKSDFAIVVKQGDFVAVGLFEGRPPDDRTAAGELRSDLLLL